MLKKNGPKKIILSGGYIARSKDNGVSFYSTMLAGLTEPVKILLCLFGMPEDSWAEIKEKEYTAITSAIPNIQISLEIASTETFTQRASLADVVYFRGGNTQNLKDYLDTINGLEQALRDKVVVGSSAGACVLSAFYLTAEKPLQLMEGLNILPTKIVTHYRSNFLYKEDPGKQSRYWDSVDKIMDTEYTDLDTIQLREGEFIVI